MKKTAISLVLAASITSVFSAQVLSAPVANLKISGDIKPPSCTVNGGNNDILFNFGAISPGVIPESSPYKLPSITSDISVVCDAMTYLSFKPEDSYDLNASPSSTWTDLRNATTFAIVNASNINETIGGIVYEMTVPMVDEVSVAFSRGNDGVDPTALWGGSGRLLKGATMGWTKTSRDGVSPSEMDFVYGKVFTATIKNNNDSNNSYILPKSKLTSQNIDLSQEVNYSGETVLAFSFGL